MPELAPKKFPRLPNNDSCRFLSLLNVKDVRPFLLGKSSLLTLWKGRRVCRDMRNWCGEVLSQHQPIVMMATASVWCRGQGSYALSMAQLQWRPVGGQGFCMPKLPLPGLDTIKQQTQQFTHQGTSKLGMDISACGHSCYNKMASTVNAKLHPVGGQIVAELDDYLQFQVDVDVFHGAKNWAIPLKFLWAPAESDWKLIPPRTHSLDAMTVGLPDSKIMFAGGGVRDASGNPVATDQVPTPWHKYHDRIWID
jgi:hypothetical protein